MCHEVGHIAAGALCGVGVKGVAVLPVGISFEMKTPRSYIHEALIAAAGPFVNLCICALIAAGIFPGGSGVTELFVFSASLGALNLLPVRSLDGGNVAAALLSAAVGREKAERIVVILGTAVIVILYLAAVYVFFYGAENFSLLLFVSVLFFLSVMKRDGDFIK